MEQWRTSVVLRHLPYISPMLTLLVALPLFGTESDRGIRLGESTKSQWRFGVEVRAVGGPVAGVLATLPVPMDWPEQQVKRVSEEKSPRIGYCEECGTNVDLDEVHNC